VESNAAHALPDLARTRHHHAAVHDILAGRTPDDARLWQEVVDADSALERATAIAAAAQAAVEQAGAAITAALTGASCWPVVLPYLARTRHDRTPAWRSLARAITWPTLDHAPASDHQDTVPRYSVWWPLNAGDLDAMRYHRAERIAFDEWAWTELADGRYDTLAPFTIRFQRAWTPDRASRVTLAGTEQRLVPVVFVGADGITSRA
jgi:hypothetical protein